MTYEVKIACSDASFRELEDGWNRLLDEAADANTFMSHAWLESWWTAYRPAATLCILLAVREGTVCGIAPMMLCRGRRAGRLLRCLRFIGDGTSETDHMNFVVKAGERREALAALLNAIDGLSWDVAHFSQMPKESDNTRQLLEFASSKGWLIGSSEVPCPRRMLPGSYEELVGSLPSRLRTAIRSARRALEQNHAVEFGSCATVGELPGCLEALFRNHESRWRGKGKQGVFVDMRKREFYSKLASRLLGSGTLRFFHLKLDGSVVAQQFCFQHGDTVFLLQEGFDFEHANLNVGNVLRLMVFEHLISNRVRQYDFLAGTSRHKQSWSDAAPFDINVRACRPSIRGRTAHYVPLWATAARRFAKRWRSRAVSS
jgi:CelD/BcsL family acetyltransferase involved in cellulose biosynthesis